MSMDNKLQDMGHLLYVLCHLYAYKYVLHWSLAPTIFYVTSILQMRSFTNNDIPTKLKYFLGVKGLIMFFNTNETVLDDWLIYLITENEINQ